MSLSHLVRITILASVVANIARATDWPEFRGPSGQGHAVGVEVPLTWGPSKNVAWQVGVPGKAWSSPVVVGERIFVTTAVETDKGLSLRALGVGLSAGEVVWDQEIFSKPDEGAFHKKNSHASPTSIVEDGRVYVHFGHHGTACLHAEDGAILWKQASLAYPPMHGNGGSPILVGNKLIFSCDGSEQPFVVALDKADGKVLWKSERGVEVSRTFSFSTPLAIEHDGQTQVVSPGSGAVIAYDPTDGSEIWRCRYGEGYSVVPRPLFAHGLVYVCTGFNNANLLAIDPSGKGDVTATHLRWEVSKRIPKESSPIVVGDHLYVNDDKGILSCFDAKSGEQLWQERIDGSGGFSGCPVYASGHLFFHNGDGVTTVIKPSTTYEKVAENRLDAYGLSSFAVVQDGFIVRTESSLWRLRQEK